MKTKAIPAIIMLMAGLIDCIISLTDNMDLLTFCIRLLIVLLVFYFLGLIVRIVIEINFSNLFNNKELSGAVPDGALENINTKNKDEFIEKADSIEAEAEESDLQ